MKYDEKALEDALQAMWSKTDNMGDIFPECLRDAISAYCEKAGVAMVSTHVLETAANCINDLADGAEGWAHEEVADELRDIVGASQESIS